MDAIFAEIYLMQIPKNRSDMRDYGKMMMWVNHEVLNSWAYYKSSYFGIEITGSRNFRTNFLFFNVK